MSELGSAGTLGYPNSAQELAHFKDNHHLYFKHSGLADTALLSLPDRAVEEMDESTKSHIFMSGGTEKGRGPFIMPMICFDTPQDEDRCAPISEAAVVGHFYIETSELETCGEFREEQFEEVMKLIVGMKRAQRIGLITGLALNLVEIGSDEKGSSEHLKPIEAYLNSLVA